MLLIVNAAPNAPYGAHSVQIVDSFWSFPQEAKDYVASKVINPLAESVQMAIQNSEKVRSDLTQIETLKRKNGLDKVEYIIRDLEATLGEESPKFQSIANEYANELCSCAVTALNEYKDVALASMFIEWAATMPSFSRIKLRIEENKENIEEWVESKEQEELNAAALATQKSYYQSIEDVLKVIRSRASSKGAVRESVNALFERLDICEYGGDSWDEDLNDDDFRSSLALNVRSLAIDIYNDYDLLDSALQISEKLAEVFFDLADVTEKLEDDIKTLRGIRKNQEDTRQRSIQRDKEITYETEIGLVFKDTLRISPNGVEWKGQRFPLESITSIRWGAVSNSINGIPTGTDYTIAFGDARSSAIVQTRRREVYDSTTDRLWKAVGIRLIEETLHLLRNGKTITFGGAVIDDKGVQLTKRGFFSKENVYREWANVTYNSYNGSLFFVDKNDSKTNLELSYLTTWNAHLLEAIVRLSYKKGLGRLSGSLD